MKLFVFTGPSLPPGLACRHWNEPTYLPPVSQGDVYRIARRKPWGIGIIDGFFERLPAVWHKEILWALSRGISVYGSASMGALRAAELAAFGMIGVGSIFEGYASGAIEDDDEVTLAHAPGGRDFRPASEAMVSIRATFGKAVREGMLPAATGERLTQIAKSLFYPYRTYDRILDEGRGQLPERELRNLLAWLPGGRVDQKRLDAMAMLDRMREDLRAGLPRKKASFSVENTVFWHRARRAASARPRRRTR